MHINRRPCFFKHRVIKPCVLRQPKYNKIMKTQSAQVIHMFEHTSYIIGKGIILFTFFYTSLNWLHYKNIQKDDKNK